MARKTIKTKETEIQMTICKYLELKGYLFWRQNVIPAFNWKTKEFRRMPKFSMTGLPDIIVIKDGGIFVGLEVKKPKGKQNENQEKFEELIKSKGGEYYVVTSLEDVRFNARL